MTASSTYSVFLREMTGDRLPCSDGLKKNPTLFPVFTMQLSLIIVFHPSISSQGEHCEGIQNIVLF